MYNHIVLAADGSENAVRAAKETIKIASLNKQCLVEIVYVADFEKARTEVLHAGSTEVLKLERRKKIQNVELLLKESEISYKVNILHGIPGPEIVKFANDNHVDLLVIGSRGLNSLQEMVLGSVSHKVIKRVQCPALVVK
ncbi:MULTISPECIES: universal stress protein [unclassified Psychrobacillus]|uniref:universal stress protein n=1 Tax=unclassified Psychrobacillus TaxID=2636677 RepID=UPI00146A4CD5|nr:MULTISPECIES: universal stress protein [unclassified Psychrobacillus]MCM3357240.1 universal stress protein [Psychrobacillus sp. MER TA 171]NME04551.1 universal stress protein [Psychrobacillus sp. BL-248-WT-3]